MPKMKEPIRMGNTQSSFGPAEAYLQYPYKAKDIDEINNNSRASKYYIKNSELTSHEHSLSMRQYIAILNCFYDVFWEYLFKGFDIELPANLGFIGIRKKYNGFTSSVLDWKAIKEHVSKTGKFKKIYYDNSHSDGYVAGIYWFKGNSSKVRKSRFWRYDFAQSRRKQLNKLIRMDYSKIYSFSDNTENKKKSRKRRIRK